MVIACIGSRELPLWTRTICEAYGSFYAEQGITVATGNAPGADQHFALGASLIDPKLVELYLPWGGFEEKAILLGNRVQHAGMARPEHVELAKRFEPNWDRLSQGTQKLKTRNAMILLDESLKPVDGCVACPSRTKPGFGGTGHGMRIARFLGVRVWLLPDGVVWNGDFLL